MHRTHGMVCLSNIHMQFFADLQLSHTFLVYEVHYKVLKYTINISVSQLSKLTIVQSYKRISWHGNLPCNAFKVND